jgi:GT2 family glycosyltransferase
VHPAWAREAIACFERDRQIGIVQCKLVLANDPRRIDYVGEYLGQYGFLVQEAEGGEIDLGQHEVEKDILAAKSAGMFMRRDVFEKVGGFDEDYFIYVEETDLGWRAWLAGSRARYLPGSIVYHEFGTSSIILGRIENEFNAKYHGSKNYILTLLKNMGCKYALWTVPAHVIMWCGLAVLLAWKGNWRPSRYILGGIMWNVRNISKTLRKRRAIQRSRTRSDSEIFPIVRKWRPMRYYINKAMSQRKVGNANGFVRPTDTSRKESGYSDVLREGKCD